MFRVLLLIAFTVGVATLTFALMALASLVSVAYRSNGRPQGHSPSRLLNRDP
jgi:hypothetical protein